MCVVLTAYSALLLTEISNSWDYARRRNICFCDTSTIVTGESLRPRVGGGKGQRRRLGEMFDLKLFHP